MANEKEAKNKKESKNKKSFFKDFKAELKKVIWPTPKQLINNTIAVVVIVVITAAVVFVLDFVFDRINKYGINNLKSHIRGTDNVVIEEEQNNETDVNLEVENDVQENDVQENETIENNNETENE